VGSRERERLVELYRPHHVNPDPRMEFGRLHAERRPYEIEDAKNRYALAWILRHPGRYAYLVWARFQFLFFNADSGEAPYRGYDPAQPDQLAWRSDRRLLLESVRLPVRTWYRILITGAALGLLATAVYEGRAFLFSSKALPLLIAAWYSIPFLLTVAVNRYNVPVLTLLWIYLANGLALAFRTLPRGTSSQGLR
jgi:hypothetical protein